jgi:hypothetical protein
MASSKVTWHGAAVLAEAERAERDLLYRLALQGEAHAKVNIVNNDQVDTGFMLNSTYAVGPAGKESDYPAAQSAASAAAARAGAVRRMMPREQVPDHTAAICTGAEYAIYQEARRTFLYKALEQLKADFPSVVGQVKKL